MSLHPRLHVAPFLGRIGVLEGDFRGTSITRKHHPLGPYSRAVTRTYGGPGGVPVSCERVPLWHLQQNIGGAMCVGRGIYAVTLSELPTRSEFPKLPRPYIHKNSFCGGMVQAARLGS